MIALKLCQIILLLMKCISGHSAEFLCINQSCSARNAFMCSNPQDECRDSHESCSLINLPFLLKKSHHERPSKNNPSRYEQLIPLKEKTKAISRMITSALSSASSNKDIHDMLEGGKMLTAEDKERISKFINDRKLDSAQDNVFFKIEKELEDLQRLIAQFQFGMKQTRDREIQQLKLKLAKEKQQHFRATQLQDLLQTQSRFNESPKRNKKVRSDKQAVDQLPRLGTLKNPDSPESRKRIVSAVFENPPNREKKSEQRRSKIKLQTSGIFERQSKLLKDHAPKGPLFSKITNDVATIYSFFSQGFKESKLLYRASENQFQVKKFHENCDGHKNTLTIVLTEFDKIIGGFTTLPWKQGGGQWYEDSRGQTFIFSLTTGEKYPLKQKQRAIWCSKNYGPSFGFPDLQIADKASSNTNSCANFPNCFNNGNFNKTPEALKIFCGSKSGHFRIRQWEVYELTL